MNTPVEKATASLRVLVVDDYPDCAESTALLLRICGHAAEVVRDGQAALAAIQASPPDVVLIDIGLPGGMDGWELARHIKRQGAHNSPFLIAMTGFGKAADRRRSAESGIDVHLTKPADPQELIALLRHVNGVRADGPS